MGIFSGLFGGGKKNKAAPPSYTAPQTLAPAENYINRFKPFTPWADTSGATATAVAKRIGDSGPGPLYNELSTQALTDLRRGGELSPEEVLAANEGARSEWGARGLGQSAPAAFSAILNRVNFAHARQDRARNFATGVESLRQKDESLNNDALGTLAGASTMGLGFAEGVRQFDQEREDSLANDRNSFNMNIYSAQAQQAAANKARSGGIFGGILSGIGNLFKI